MPVGEFFHQVCLECGTANHRDDDFCRQCNRPTHDVTMVLKEPQLPEHLRDNPNDVWDYANELEET